MKMDKGDKLFVRIDYRNNDKNFEDEDFKKHLDYLRGVASERYFIGGGFEHEKGGMIIFEAKDMDEAKEIAENDPIINRGLFTCKIYEWNLLLLSEEMNN